MAQNSIELTLSPAVLTTGLVQNTGLPIARDGIKKEAILEQIENALSNENFQTLVSGDPANTAVTGNIVREALNRLVITLQNAPIANSQVIINCISILTQAIEEAADSPVVQLNRGHMEALALTLHEVEEVQAENSETTAKARIAFNVVSNTEYVNQPSIQHIEAVVNTINEEVGNDVGTELLQRTVDTVPTDIGLAPNGTTIRSGDIPLDSQAAVRTVMGNHGQDTKDAEYLASADAFTSSDIAVTPLANMKPLLDLAADKTMTGPSPYRPHPLKVTKNAEGLVTDVSYEEMEPLTEEEIALLDMTKPLMDQDWSAVAYTTVVHDIVGAVYTCSNYRSVPLNVTKADNLIQMYPSKRIVSGQQAFGILSGVNKLWNAFKNHTGASNANIGTLIGIGTKVAGNIIRRRTTGGS